ELKRAQGLYCESLTMRRDLGDRQGIVLTLIGLGHLAHRQHLDERATRLLAAGSTLGEEIGGGLPASGLAEHERIMHEIRQSLGEPRYTAAWTDGAAMSM